MAKRRRSAGIKRETRVLIVEARYYTAIADVLLEGATRVLDDAGVKHDRVTVPGALEIPAAIAIVLDANKSPKNAYDGVVALGCVIQGETFHFDIVATQSARALMDLAVARKLPVGNGILTVDTEAQAKVRADPQQGDKGGEAARAALTLIQLKRSAAYR